MMPGWRGVATALADPVIREWWDHLLGSCRVLPTISTGDRGLDTFSSPRLNRVAGGGANQSTPTVSAAPSIVVTGRTRARHRGRSRVGH